MYSFKCEQCGRKVMRLETRGNHYIIVDAYLSAAKEKYYDPLRHTPHRMTCRQDRVDYWHAAGYI